MAAGESCPESELKPVQAELCAVSEENDNAVEAGSVMAVTEEDKYNASRRRSGAECDSDAVMKESHGNQTDSSAILQQDHSPSSVKEEATVLPGDGMLASATENSAAKAEEVVMKDVDENPMDSTAFLQHEHVPTPVKEETGALPEDCMILSAEETSTAKAEDVTWTPPWFGGTPRLLTSLSSPFGGGNFTKGCKWSPDGTCLLVCSEDTRLRLLNLPPALYAASEPPQLTEPPQVALQSHEGELIYDYAWFPLMRSDTPATCCYASSSRGHPIHLFDAFDGGLRCSYRAYNSVDEVTAAYSLAFDPDGGRLYAGLDGALTVFDVSRPGRQLETRKLKDKKSPVAQPGMVSCVAFCASCPELYAVGTYLRSVGLYSAEDGSPLCLLQGQTGGVTHLQFSPDGNRLYSGGRKDPEILCWDLRNLGHILYSLERRVTTNQRVYFDCDVTGRFLFSGDSEGCVQVWDTMTPPSECGEELILPSSCRFSNNRCGSVNGVSAHPWLPVLATSCGERHLYGDGSAASGEDSDVEVAPPPDSAVKLWWLSS